MLKIIVVVGAVLSISAVAALAAEPRFGSCAADVKARCKGVQPGEGRVKVCLKEHIADLSPACQARMARVAAVAEACGADIKQSCSGVKPGGGRVMSCLRSALSKLSDACKDAVTQAVARGR